MARGSPAPTTTSNSTPTSELLDTLSNADVARLVTEAANGKLKSAKALRDALMLPVTIQKVQQILSSDDFQAKVKQAAKSTSSSNKRATRTSGKKADETTENDDGEGEDDEDEPMGEKDIDSDDEDGKDDDDDDDDNDDDNMDDASDDDDEAPVTRGKLKAKRPASGSSEATAEEKDGDDTEGTSDAEETDPREKTRKAKATTSLAKKRPQTATVTKADGTQVTISANQEFKDRSLVKSIVRDFATAQGKSVLIHRKTNGGNNFMYVCKSQTKCDFYVKIRRSHRKSTTTHIISSFHAEHGSECSGKPPNPRRQPKSQLLPPAKTATVTMKDGVKLTLRERQEFATREQLKDFIHDFALAQEKRARVDRLSSGGNNITFVCTSQTKCNFKVRTLRSKRTGKHYVKSFEADHGEECTGKPSVTKRQVLNHLKRLETSPTLALSGPDVQAIVKSMQGVDVTSRVAADARFELVGRVLKDAMIGIQKLESLLTQFQSLNPTASMQVEIGADSTFKRAFLKLPYSNQVQAHGARILGLNSSEMSPSSNFHGILFELVVKDGNNDSYVIAVALCDGKSAENYTWFFNCCALAGISLNAPMLCDRNSAILNAVESLPISFTLIQCTQNLITNIEEKLSLSSDVRAQVLRAQAAETEKEFKSILMSLGAANAPVAEHLRNTDPNTWAKYCFLLRYPLYGCQTAALVQTESNPSYVSTRGLSPFEFFQSYMERCMKSVYEGKRQAKSWMNSGRTLTAYAEKVLKDQEIEALSCRVVPSDDEKGIAYIWDTRSAVPKKRRVNLSMNSCSCSFLDQFALPCKHLVAAASFFNSDGASWDISQLCHPMYTAKSYFDVYGQVSPIDIPVEEELVRNLTVKIAPGSTSNRCSLCHEIGHNKRRCKKNDIEKVAAAPPTMTKTMLI